MKHKVLLRYCVKRRHGRRPTFSRLEAALRYPVKVVPPVYKILSRLFVSSTLSTRVLTTSRPTYLKNKLVARSIIRERKTRQDALLAVPRVRLERGKNGFSHFGPQRYNCLPPEMKYLSMRAFNKKKC
ncbi:hypothetical protein J6590_025832 [Homalodisca vitripennis]|nr:hypothetical protein J6590_025832 [Homalodisca vitripennis]